MSSSLVEPLMTSFDIRDGWPLFTVFGSVSISLPSAQEKKDKNVKKRRDDKESSERPGTPRQTHLSMNE